VSWLQIALEVPGSVADGLSDFCLEMGAVSAVLDNAGPDELVEAVLEPAPGATILWERVVISAFWDLSTDIGAVSNALRQRFHDDGIFGEITVNFKADDDFGALPAQPVASLSFGAGRLRLVPRDFVDEGRADDEGRAADAGGTLIRLDPGLAFGSGLHPTTQLCLEALAGLAAEGSLASARVLDFGCGSGVLALAARALGATRVHGVDHDPQALVATADNAAYNNLASGLHAYAPSELPADARYEVVVANILANPLIELAAQLSDRLVSGGTLILAGVCWRLRQAGSWLRIRRLILCRRRNTWIRQKNGCGWKAASAPGLRTVDGQR